MASNSRLAETRPPMTKKSPAETSADPQSHTLQLNAGQIGTVSVTPADSISTTIVPVKQPHSSVWYRVISTLVLLGLATGAYFTRDRWLPALDAFVRPDTANQRPKPRPPLVSLATVNKEAVPQYINCLGTVTALNNVLVRSRVDGELIEVKFSEGKMVQEGEHLATIDPRAYVTARDQVKGNLQRDQAALDVAKLNYDRMANLPLKDIASQQERDEMFAIYKQAEAVLEVDRAALANAELQLTYTKIVAPISGRIGLRAIDRGNIVRASDLLGLLTITQLQPINVVFPIPQDEIPRIQKQLASSGTTTVLAYDRSFQTLLATGTLSAIDNQVDTTTGTLRLKAVFENKDESLFPNQFVNIRLLMQTWDQAIVIPSSAVQRGPDFSYVYVANEEDSSVDVQKVTVAFSEAGKSVIASGLDEGMKVVTEGTDKLQPKGKVTLPGAKPQFGDKPQEGGKPEGGKPGEHAGEKGRDKKAGGGQWSGKASSDAGKPSDSKPAQ